MPSAIFDVSLLRSLSLYYCIWTAATAGLVICLLVITTNDTITESLERIGVACKRLWTGQELSPPQRQWLIPHRYDLSVAFVVILRMLISILEWVLEKPQSPGEDLDYANFTLTDETIA